MDTEEDEQERGITIDAANVSMTHEYEDNNHLINLIDTPGHVDFGGDVTRAMRAVDGALVVVDAVEGTMPQTETVVRQALREGVKPALFINKVDRLINELQEGPEEMQERLQTSSATSTSSSAGWPRTSTRTRAGRSPSRTGLSPSAPRSTTGATSRPDAGDGHRLRRHHRLQPQRQHRRTPRAHAALERRARHGRRALPEPG